MDFDAILKWDESKHPRKPAGTEAGGEFTGETVSLYRGDSRDINPTMGHADPGALFGSGIYLTDKKQIAGDYRAKGAEVLFRRLGGTKQEAIDAYIYRLATMVDEYGNESYSQVMLHTNPNDPGRKKRMKFAQKAWEQQKPNVEIRKLVTGEIIIREKAKPGVVSHYAVPKAWVDRTLDAEAEITDKTMEAIAGAFKSKGMARDVRQFAETEDESGYRPSFREVYRFAAEESSMMDDGLNTVGAQDRFREALQELGYKGIRYAGGITLGGGHKHTAYLFWDDEALTRAKVRAKKADPSGRFVTPFVSFDQLGDNHLQMISSLNASRLATWGFTAEAEMRGVERYRLTAVLDGRTSKFCRMIDGKVFDVEDGREKVIEALRVQNPDDLKVVQPWPRQDKASMAEFAKMSDEEFVARGLHIPPYHPHCRTVCILAEGTQKKKPSPLPEPGISDQMVTVETLAEMGITATQEEVDQWNSYVGLSPAEIVAKISGTTPPEVLSGKAGKSTIDFESNGNISVSAKGINADVKYSAGTVIDPFTGNYYLSQAELVGDVAAATRYLKQLFGALTETAVSAELSTVALAVAGDAAPYVKLGFLPEEIGWEDLRVQALAALDTSSDLKAMMASFKPEDALLIRHLLINSDPMSLQALVDLKLRYQGKTVAEWLFQNVTGTYSMDLSDPLVLEQIKAYLS